MDYNGSASLGAKSVVGAELTRFIFYSQISLIAMSYAPSKSEYTKYTQNGVDQLGRMTIYQKNRFSKAVSPHRQLLIPINHLNS